MAFRRRRVLAASGFIKWCRFFAVGGSIAGLISCLLGVRQKLDRVEGRSADEEIGSVATIAAADFSVASASSSARKMLVEFHEP